MKKCALAMLLLWCLGLCGCFMDAPQPVKDARGMRAAAYAEYAANNGRIVDFVIEQYRAAEYARIEFQIDLDVAATKKLPDAAAAVAQMLAIEKNRTTNRAAVEAQIAKLRVSVAKAQQDLAIAAKLDEAIVAYENAGIDATAISGAADSIMSILKATMGGK